MKEVMLSFKVNWGQKALTLKWIYVIQSTTELHHLVQEDSKHSALDVKTLVRAASP